MVLNSIHDLPHVFLKSLPQSSSRIVVTTCFTTHNTDTPRSRTEEEVRNKNAANNSFSTKVCSLLDFLGKSFHL